MPTILLGAGASVEAGVPSAKTMARSIYDHISGQYPIALRAIQTAIGGLKFYRSTVEEDPFGEIDVEDLYELLRSLQNREFNLLASFVGSWSHAIVAAERPDVDEVARLISEGLSGSRFRYASGLSVGGVDLNTSELQQSLKDGLSLLVGHDGSAFSLAADHVLECLIRFSVIKNSGSVSYLVPLLMSAARNPIWIASLNYDNAIELAATRAGIDIDIGVRAENSSIQFAEASKVCLAKLHGSVDWSYDTSGRLRIGHQSTYEPALIFGSGNKLRIDGPYLDLLFSFRSQLEKSDELQVCGYSFRDQHVNYVIQGWLGRNQGRFVSVFDPILSGHTIVENMHRVRLQGWSLNDSEILNRIRVQNVTASEWARSFQ